MASTCYQSGYFKRTIFSQIALVLLYLMPYTRNQTNWDNAPYFSPYHTSYSELQELKVDCIGTTCSVMREKDDIIDSFCHCGQECSMLDTCCVDSRYNYLPRIPYGSKHRCMKVFATSPPHVFIVDHCKGDWTGENYFQEMCEADGQLLSDVLLLIPGTNTRKQTTYKNIYCALCNDEDRRDIVFWNLHLFVKGEGGVMKVDPSELHNLKFVDQRWRLADNDKQVTFEMDIPSRIRPYVIRCPTHDIVSTCASNWNDYIVKQKCASYMAIVVSKDFDVPYRNVHCAICNFQSIDNLACKAEGVIDSRKTPFNLGLLLDINPSTGPLVGRQQKCKEDHIYHPTKEICIPLAGCFIGHVLEDGECVRKKQAPFP